MFLTIVNIKVSRSFYLLLTLILVACTPSARTIEPEQSMQLSLEPTITVTPTTTPTATPTPTPKWSKVMDLEISSYTTGQIELIQNGAYKKEEQMLTRWMSYWSAVDPVTYPLDKFHFKYVFSPNNPMEAGVLLEVHGDYQGKAFYVPIEDGRFMVSAPIPRVDEKSISEGREPFELTGGAYTLSFIDGEWVKVNWKRDLIQTLNMETTEWEWYFSDEMVERLPQDWVWNEDRQIDFIRDIKSGRLLALCNDPRVYEPFEPVGAEKTKKVDGVWVAYNLKGDEIGQFFGEEKGWRDSLGNKLRYRAVVWDQLTVKDGPFGTYIVPVKGSRLEVEVKSDSKKSPFKKIFDLPFSYHGDKWYLIGIRVLDRDLSTKVLFTYFIKSDKLIHVFENSMWGFYFPYVSRTLEEEKSKTIHNLIKNDFPNIANNYPKQWLITGNIPEEIQYIPISIPLIAPSF